MLKKLPGEDKACEGEAGDGVAAPEEEGNSDTRELEGNLNAHVEGDAVHLEDEGFRTVPTHFLKKLQF